jgi:hypothetical protein
MYIQAFEIDAEYNTNSIGVQGWILSDIQNLSRILNILGITKFKEIWRDVRGKECQERLILAIEAISAETQRAS